MKKSIFSLTVLFFCLQGLQAQKFFTRQGKISFYSSAPTEKIEAHNSSATAVVDPQSGNMEFAVLIKGFQFEKALMQEHFNENYLESSLYPKAVFKGSIVNRDAVNLGKDGTYPAVVKGDMTLHGVTKSLETKGVFVVKNGLVSASAEFNLLLDDYKIEIPALVKDNISKTVQVVAKFELQPLK